MHPLAETSWLAFAPRILDGRVHELHGEAGEDAAPEAWRLWAVECGTVALAAGHRWRRQPGPVVFLTAPGSRHRYDAGCRYRWLAFRDEGHGGWSLPVALDADRQAACRPLLRSWTDRWWRSPADYLACTAELTRWLLDLCRPQAAAAGGGAPSWLGRLHDLVREQLEHGPTAAGLAAAAGMSRAQLYRRLAAHGRRVGDVIDAVREETALAYLCGGLARVAGIARMCGFASSSIFTRWFKRRLGLTPTAWRRRHLPGFTAARLDGIPRRRLGRWAGKPRYP